MSMIIEFITNLWNIGMVIVGLTISAILWIKGKGSDNLRGYIPTLWTSLGILCTFMAIYVSFSGYTSNIMHDSSISLQNDGFNINSLIREVIPAFSTSIIGIIGAIISTITNRWVSDEMERADNEQFLKIKRSIPGSKILSNSPEMVLLEIISAIRESSSKTCEKLNYNNSSSVSKLDQLCTKIEDLGKTTSNVGEEIQVSITDALKQQREEFSSAFSLLSQTFISKLSEQSDILAKKMDELRRMLHDEVKSIEDTNQTLLTRLIDQERELLKLTTDTLLKDSDNRNTTLQNFVTNHNKQLNDSFAEITAGMGALYQKIEEKIEKHMDEEKLLFEHDIKDTIEEFAKAQYKTCCDTITKCNDDLTSSAAAIHKDQVEASTQFISKLEDIFGGVCSSFDEKTETLSKRLTDRLHEINEGNITVLKDTIEQNRVTIQSILDKHSESINATSEQIKNEQINIHKTISEEITRLHGLLNNQLDDYIKEISKTMTKTCELLEANSQNVVNVSVSINSAMDNLKNNIVESNEDLKANIDDLKIQIVDSLSTISNDISNKIANTSQIKQLEATALQLNEAINKSIEKNNENMDKISAVISSSVEAIEKSANIYSNSVSKSDMITKYMEGTTRLFMNHTNAVAALDKSLSAMEKSINRMCDNISVTNSKSSKGKSVDK